MPRTPRSSSSPAASARRGVTKKSASASASRGVAKKSASTPRGAAARPSVRATAVTTITAPAAAVLDGNFVRRKTDYAVMLAILGCMIGAGEYFFPQRSSAADLRGFMNLYDVFGLGAKHGAVYGWAAWWLITSLTMHGTERV